MVIGILCKAEVQATRDGVIASLVIQHFSVVIPPKRMSIVPLISVFNIIILFAQTWLLLSDKDI